MSAKRPVGQYGGHQFVHVEETVLLIVSTMDTMNKPDDVVAEAKEMEQKKKKRHKEEEDDNKSGIDDLQGLQELISTKYTSAQLAKEQKKLSKLDKTIGVHSGKLQKSRNSLSDAKTTPKKQEKEMKKVAKAAETIGVLEVEREAQNMKVEKLKELITDRQSLVCVVKRNSVQLVSATSASKPHIIDEAAA